MNSSEFPNSQYNIEYYDVQPLIIASFLHFDYCVLSARTALYLNLQSTVNHFWKCPKNLLTLAPEIPVLFLSPGSVNDTGE